MLQAIIGALGVDLDHELSLIKAQLEAYRRQTTDELRAYGREAGVVGGLIAAGATFALLAVLAALAALFLFVERFQGPHAALATVGLATAMPAAVLLSLAYQRSRRPGKAEVVAVEAPASTPRPGVAPAGVQLTAINRAEDIVRSGSRSALLATLALTAVVGILYGRRRRE